jgi:hypothetical protein
LGQNGGARPGAGRPKAAARAGDAGDKGGTFEEIVRRRDDPNLEIRAKEESERRSQTKSAAPMGWQRSGQPFARNSMQCMIS